MAPTPSSSDPPPSPSSAEPEWSIDRGIDPAGWTPEVHDALANLRQGHLVESPPFAYYADGARPIHGMTRAWAEGRGSQQGVVSAATPEYRPPYGIITTQTCDLVEEGCPGRVRNPKRPWVQISPVYFRRCETAGEARGIRAGRIHDYLAWTSALEEHDHGVWVADLRISVPVEKGWLVGRSGTPAFRDVDGESAFAEQIARLAARVAHSRPLNDLVLRPLSDRLKQLCAEHPSSDGIEEVLLELGHDRRDPELVRVVFIGDAPIPTAVQAALSAWWATTFAAAQPEELHVLEPEFTTFDLIGTARYRRLEQLDLSALSPPA